MTRRTTLAAAAAAAALALIPGQAHAILTSCTATMGSVNFPVLSGAAPVQAAGILRVSCTGIGRLNPFTVALSTGASGSYTTRRMTSGTNTLNYNLYTNPGRTTIFGNGTGGSSTVTGVIDFVLIIPATADVVIYGLVPAQGMLTPGGYLDSIVATIVY